MSTAAPTTLDVRPVDAARKLESVLSVVDGLSAGASFVLVDDVDPAPMRLQVENERPGEIRWMYLKRGPHVWCVRVERGPSAA
ncbi:MAG: DUF2249 domain-containing protein [Salinibacter sp.]|uniref:DUF2249 domain-containing protein n=1 Tax=Salinibacter sp. TaxID=2065818 RepID=UPI002FC3B009